VESSSITTATSIATVWLRSQPTARRAFENLPGLRFKFFTFDEKQHRVVNFHVWDSREQGDAFFSEELRRRVSDVYGAPPAIEYIEIAQTVCNPRPSATSLPTTPGHPS
jgi:hypothetical protein